jgi:hypothetical protein
MTTRTLIRRRVTVRVPVRVTLTRRVQVNVTRRVTVKRHPT